MHGVQVGNRLSLGFFVVCFCWVFVFILAFAFMYSVFDFLVLLRFVNISKIDRKKTLKIKKKKKKTQKTLRLSFFRRTVRLIFVIGPVQYDTPWPCKTDRYH